MGRGRVLSLVGGFWDDLEALAFGLSLEEWVGADNIPDRWSSQP